MKIPYLPESDPKHPHREFKLCQLLPLQMPKRNRGYILTSTGAQKLREAKRGWEIQHSDRCTQEKMRDLTSTFKENGLDTGTIRKIFKAEKEVDKESICCLFSAFNLQLDDGDLEQVKQNDISNLISSNPNESETGEALMSLATSMLEHLGFNQMFRVNTTSQYIGYRLKKTGEGAKQYQLILAQQPKYLSISIHRRFLEREILQLRNRDYVYEGYSDSDGDAIGGEAIGEEYILGEIWVIPSKEDVFLKSMQFQYPNILQGEVSGKFLLIELDDELDRFYSLVTQEFNIQNLSDSDSYVIVQNNEIFPYTGQVYISSKKVLEEFFHHFGIIIMEKL